MNGQGKPHAVHHYHTKAGQPLSTTLGAQAERIEPGFTTEQTQDSSSFLYHCFDGRGDSIVESSSGERRVLSWELGDTFAVPAWSKVQHVNRSETQPAYLVSFHDGPFLDLLELRPPSAP
ncbi:hypothetical protein CDD83_6257 [Cordyceps sp. RAO-2017]|nr:hypothetical protein CDD83_6257 [Cordyceps sp. RAO-2017]